MRIPKNVTLLSNLIIGTFLIKISSKSENWSAELSESLPGLLAMIDALAHSFYLWNTGLITKFSKTVMRF